MAAFDLAALADLARTMEPAPRLPPRRARRWRRGSEPPPGNTHDFEIDLRNKANAVTITNQGSARVEQSLGNDTVQRIGHGTVMSLLGKALVAEWVYKRDNQYLVIDGRIQLVSEFTGRLDDGRRLADEDLWRAIEVKEGVAISPGLRPS